MGESRYAVFTTTTAVRLLIEGHQGPSDAARAADPLAAVALTYLLI